MKFRYVVEVDVKNDGLTQDCGYDDLARMIQADLENNQLKTLPWVINQRYRRIGEGNEHSQTDHS